MADDRPNETIAEIKKMDDLEWQRHQLQKKARLDAEFEGRNQEDGELSERGTEGLREDERYTTKD